jgi:hypothetical protein
VHLARILGQATAYAAFGATIAWLSADPVWRHHDPAQAQIKLSFSHAGAKVGDCRRLTPEEIAALPPNMRKPMDCPRGRVPVVVELELDGSTVVSASLAPTGIAGDGPSSAYRRFAVAAGEHRIVARLRDSRRAEGFDYESATTVVLAPRQNFVVDFQSTLGGFRFR